jgi:hypothetical protein
LIAAWGPRARARLWRACWGGPRLRDKQNLRYALTWKEGTGRESEPERIQGPQRARFFRVLGRRERCRAGNGPAIPQQKRISRAGGGEWPQTRNASGAEILQHPTQIAMAFQRAKSREAVVYVLPKKRIEIRALASAGAMGPPDWAGFAQAGVIAIRASAS